MSSLALAGASYQLRAPNTDRERTVNWFPCQIESGNGKGGKTFYLKQAPGMTKVATLAGPIRGFAVARDKLYVIAGNKLQHISSTWNATEKGTLSSNEGGAETAVNNTQIAIVDGPNGYVYDLDAGSFAPIASSGFRGSKRVDTLDGYGIFADTEKAQFYLSAIQDFTTLDPLDFATAESSAGKLISFLVKHREALFFKDVTTEVWDDTGGTDFALSRNLGANIETGCSACYSLRKGDGIAYWLGRGEQGAAVVYRMSTYSPERISTHALEEALSSVDDLSTASSFCYQQEGHSFYVLNVPGLDTTWVYDLATNMWHERAEWVNGAYQPWRATGHAYCYGKHIVGDEDGNLYVLDPTVNSYDGDIMVRDRITPHQALPTLTRERFGSFQVDCETGIGLPLNVEARMMLRYSDDGGRAWSNWRYMTLGKVGQRLARARATMLGASRDRIWHIRVTDDVPCNPISAVVNEI